MALKLEFAPLSTPPKGVLIVFCDDALKFGAAARRVLAVTGDLVARAAAAERFKGKLASTLDIVAPAGLEVSRLVVVGVGKGRDLKARDFAKLGGVAMEQRKEETLLDVVLLRYVGMLPVLVHGGGPAHHRAAGRRALRPRTRARRRSRHRSTRRLEP